MLITDYMKNPEKYDEKNIANFGDYGKYICIIIVFISCL